MAPAKALSTQTKASTNQINSPQPPTHPKKLTRKSKITQPTRFFRTLLEYKHDNFADRWNAANHSPKRDKSFDVKRYYETSGKTKEKN